MAYELNTELHSQHLGLRSDYGSYSFPKRRRKDKELLFRVIQRLKEAAEVQVMCKCSAAVTIDYYYLCDPARAHSRAG